MATLTTSATPRSKAGTRADLIVFTLLVGAISLLCALALHGVADFAALDKSPGWVWGVLVLISWIPALAALGTQMLRTGSVRGFASGMRRPARRWVLVALAVPCTYATAVAALTWITGAGELDPHAFLHAATDALGTGWASPSTIALCYAALTVVGGTLALSLFALGEELGWSGFVIPRLLPILGIPRTALVTGALWSAYHFPLILLAKNYTQGATAWFTMLGLTIALTGMAFLSVWLRARSSSIWPMVLLHAGHNVWMFYLYEPLTRPRSLTPYIGGEHGVGMMLVALVLALLVTRDARTFPAFTFQAASADALLDAPDLPEHSPAGHAW